jgi:four helix bundle protein
MIHTESEVWKAAMELAVVVYRVTKSLPREERFGLAAQMNRAAASVPSNVAEGAGRETVREKRRFLIDARGSITELETQLELCFRLGFLSSGDLERTRPVVLRARQLLAGTIRSLTARMPRNA